MAFNGSGTFIRLKNWVVNASLNINILPDLMDLDTNDIAAGLSLCVTRDGQGAPNANITWSGYQINNLGAPTVLTDAANKAYVDLATGTRSMGGFKLTNVATPVAGTDAANMAYVQSLAYTNASQLLGNTWAAPGAIGSTTPAAGSFTTLSASSGLLVNGPTTLSATNTGQMSYENPNTRYYIGDGTGYSFRFSKRIGSVTTDLVTILDSGGLNVTGAVNIIGPAGLGYGAGAGGTVTQATDKGTTVTLNKPTGQITMNSASLAAGASISFLLSNTLLSGTDTIIVNNSSALIANYSVRSNVTPGAAAICVKNESAGSLSDALVINFTIIKGSAT